MNLEIQIRILERRIQQIQLPQQLARQLAQQLAQQLLQLLLLQLLLQLPEQQELQDLTNADLTGANLSNVNLSGKNLTGATLTGATLTGANLTNATLTGATLTGVVGVIDFNNIKFDDELTVKYGGPGGSEFRDISNISKIQFRGGDVLERIYINGTGYGGREESGTDTNAIILSADEYINEVTMSQVSYLGFFITNSLEIKTSKGNTISCGNKGGEGIITLKNIKVTKIGGRSGNFVDSISITFTKI
jgi:hypothetical protein